MGKYHYSADKAEGKIRERMESGNISESDGERILQFKRHLESEDMSENTVINYVSRLGRLAMHTPGGIHQTDPGPVLELIDSYASGKHDDVKDDGINVDIYQTAYRVYVKYYDTLGIDPETIEITQYDGRNLTPDDLFYKEEVDEFLTACIGHPRDQAFVALALATGQRIDALRTLRLKHITTNGPTMDIRLNDDEGKLKGANGTKPLLWAKHYVRPWLEAHPYKNDPEAGLFVPERESDRKRLENMGKDPKEPVRSSTLRDSIHRRLNETSINKEIYPHLFRHCAITRMVTEGLSEQQIKQLVGWAPDSSQFETYVSLADDLNNDSIREALDLPTTENTPVVGRPSFEKCPNCNDELPAGSERCTTCQNAITHREYLKDKAEEKEAADAFDVVLEEARNDPEKAVELLDALREELL
jgi:integrase